MPPLTPERLERFKTIATGLDGQTTILITQMDPDAIGAAMLLRLILERHLGCKVTTYFAGTIDHPQTWAIFNYYRLSERMTPIPKDLADLGKVILVDSSLRADTRMQGKKYAPVIVIDHHDKSDVPDNGETWVWCEPVGATVTLVVELADQLEVALDDSEVATMGALGIATDTQNFTEGVDRKRDRRIWARLLDLGSDVQYSALSRYDFPERYFQLLHQLLSPESFTFHQTLLVTHCGLIDPNEMAYLSRAADMLIRHEQAQTVIVWAPLRGVGICIKFRSEDPSGDLADLIVTFAGSGGAKSKHGVASGGSIIVFPDPLVPSEQNEKEVVAMFRASIVPRLEAIAKR
jgi:nanoRNase/pAp phosphatase (c-di-AMP/oligoRNAs hydrolase)